MRSWIALSLWVSVALILTLVFFSAPEFWPSPESPPRQGEALADGKLSSGRTVHSEAALARLIREPQNTWSNLAFVICGAWLATASTLRMSRMAGAALIMVGIGSFLYHASASTTFRTIDVGSMYGLFFILVCLAAASLSGRILKLTENHPALILACAGLLAVVLTMSRPHWLHRQGRVDVLNLPSIATGKETVSQRTARRVRESAATWAMLHFRCSAAATRRNAGRGPSIAS